jgi:hypothetical protein
MKKLTSLVAFYSQKIEKKSSRLVFGGLTGSSSTESTAGIGSCTDSVSTTSTDNGDGTKTVSRTTTTNCP